MEVPMMQDSRAGGQINPITLRKWCASVRRVVNAPYLYLITGFKKLKGPMICKGVTTNLRLEPEA
jgi:hypothetical protein